MSSSSPGGPGNANLLLEEGLTLYGRGEEAQAVECWVKVLKFFPKHPEARDYLRSAGIDPDAVVAGVKGSTEAPPPNKKRKSSLWRTATDTVTRLPRPVRTQDQLKRRIASHMSAKEYDQALELLYVAHDSEPDDKNIIRSIQHLRNRVIAQLMVKLGGLDLVPLRPETPVAALPAEQQVIARLIDGHASFDDLLRTSPLGRLRTLETLVAMSLETEDPWEALSVPDSGLTKPPGSSIPTSGALALGAQEAEMPLPNDFDELLELGTNAVLDRNHALAHRAFERANLIQPGHPVIRANLDRLDAMGYAALPRDFESLLAMGEQAIEDKDHDLAHRAFSLATELEPDHPRLKENVVLLLKSMGFKDAEDGS